ncbi:hypothetical protein [Natrialba sp. INN-245]|uniref:hypothetical protein n=1 Tax=Natrialba sp. INN-245 TaxID=2690967 RepID=UPI0013114CC8|nr:hypothetical protein [Natrialba sp. INN-245]MWV40123.1 hypothetical protein [Natrialba sp. INN-245]
MNTDNGNNGEGKARTNTCDTTDVDPEAIRAESFDNYTVPTGPAIERHMNELDENGVRVVVNCECGDDVETKALPNTKTFGSICRDCAEAHLWSEGLL